MNGNIAGVHAFKTAADKDFRDGVTEDVAHAYYHGDKPLHPYGSGETDPDFTGWNGDQKYSWVKAPRFNGATDAGRSAGAGAGRLRARPSADPQVCGRRSTRSAPSAAFR
jgi:hypothetical protein